MICFGFRDWLLRHLATQRTGSLAINPLGHSFLVRYELALSGYPLALRYFFARLGKLGFA